MKARRSLAALQLATSASSLIAVCLAVAMTFPTPPLFDLQRIYTLRPGLLFWSQALGVIGLVLAPWTVSAQGRWLWLAVVSTTLAAAGLGLGFGLSYLIANAA